MIGSRRANHEEARVANVPVDRLRAHPRNVRHELGDLRELAASIANEGVLVPVMAEQRGETLRLLHGHRRAAAARIAGLHRIPAVIVAPRADDQAIALMVAENTQRRTLSAGEKRDAVDALHGHGWTVEQIAQRLGVSSSTVSVWRRGAVDTGAEPNEAVPADDDVDEVAVERVVSGGADFKALAVGEQKAVVVRLRGQGLGTPAMAERLGTYERLVTRRLLAAGVSGPGRASGGVRRVVSIRKVAGVLDRWDGHAPADLLAELRNLTGLES